MIIGIDAHNLEGNRTGVGRYLLNLLKIWVQISSGSHSDTATYRSGNSIKFVLYFKDEIPGDIPKSDRFESKLLKAGSTAKFVHWDLPRAAKKDGIDILFCPGYVAPLIYKGKTALVLHDIIYEAHPEWFNWQSSADKILLKWVSKKSAQKAKIIFTPSEFSRQEIIKYFQVAPKKVAMVSAAADPDLRLSWTQNSQEEIEKIKVKYALKENFIFFVGSIFSRRHLPEMLEAFFRLAREKSDYQMLIGGKNYTQPLIDIDKLIKEKNNVLGRRAILRVDFIGDSDLKLLYSACAFFIYLSDYEGFGLPPLEAMSCGAPVITSNSASLKEVAGDAAFLIKNNSDVEEIYRAMKRLIDDETLRQQLVKRGGEQAGKFSWEICAKKVLIGLLNS